MKVVWLVVELFTPVSDMLWQDRADEEKETAKKRDAELLTFCAMVFLFAFIWTCSLTTVSVQLVLLLTLLFVMSREIRDLRDMFFTGMICKDLPNFLRKEFRLFLS